MLGDRNQGQEPRDVELRGCLMRDWTPGGLTAGGAGGFWAPRVLPSRSTAAVLLGAHPQWGKAAVPGPVVSTAAKYCSCQRPPAVKAQADASPGAEIEGSRDGGRGAKCLSSAPPLRLSRSLASS